MTAHVRRRRRPAGLALLATGLAVLAVSLGGTSARGAVSLGTATSFAVLGNTTITNTGATTINGDVGLYPGTAVTGFGTVTRSGALHVGNAVAQQALVDAGAAYGALQSRTPCTDLTGQVLGQTVGTAAQPLLPGVYCFSSSAQLTGDLYLSGGGEYVFRIGSTLTTASGSHVILQSGADACNVFWALGSSATLGTNSQIVGTIIANISITANTGAVVNGRLFALTGAVTLDANTIGGPGCPPATTTTTAPPAATTTTAPGATTTTAPGATTTTAPGVTTTTAPGVTTTTAPGATTTTAPPAATTTTETPGGTVIIPGSGGTTSTLVPGTTTSSPAASTTTSTVRAGVTTTAVGASPGATGTAGPGATGTASPGATGTGGSGATRTAGPGATTAPLGGLLSPAAAGLRSQPLAQTGQGVSGPLSLAVASIFLGALLLLAPRRDGVPALTGLQVSGTAQRPAAVDERRPHSSVRVSAPTTAPGTRGEVRAAPAAGPVGHGSGDLMEALERQLQAADARLARLRAMPD